MNQFRLGASRLLSTTRTFPSTSTKELALPIALLSSECWSKESPTSVQRFRLRLGSTSKGPDENERYIDRKWKPWLDILTKSGYTCQTVDVDHDPPTLESFERELTTQIRQSPSPFPPLLCAYGLGTMIAETYVSSHPLSGLLLVDPPLTPEQARRNRPDVKSLLSESLEGFDYEPFFPIAILTSRKRAEELETHRLRRDYGDEVHLLVTPDEDPISEDGCARVKDWMDANGL